VGCGVQAGELFSQRGVVTNLVGHRANGSFWKSVALPFPPS
jgi:hypothetical protein